MSKQAKIQGRIVFPGERLGVVEEFFPGSGLYQKNGVIRSAELGTIRYDPSKRELAVSKINRSLLLPREGMEVYGEVGSVMRHDAMVDVFILDGKLLPSPYTGIIQSLDGNRNMLMEVRNGDIVKAKIINTKNRILQLSIDSSDYGVVYAYCSKCGMFLENHRNRLACPRCGRVERRKISTSYGAEELN
ncbi:exosome complex RNA-binding protein Csl4 [Candidatus Bathyarchaeota archaeon]|nr:exosome complex RNA-binding protein Csl4 [Candidatus Bathyarchaeota archaeon]